MVHADQCSQIHFQLWDRTKENKLHLRDVRCSKKDADPSIRDDRFSYGENILGDETV